MADKDTVSLSTTLAEIQSLVNKLESDDVELQQSLEMFEKGVELIRSAQSLLSQTEQRVQELITSADETGDYPGPE